MKLKLTLFVTLSVLILTSLGCDKGYKTYDKAMEDYGHILTEGITADNVRDAQTFAAMLKVLITAYPDKGSAKQGKIKLEALKKLASDRKTALESELAGKVNVGVAGIMKMNEQFQPLLSKLQKSKKTRGFIPDSQIRVQVGQCYAHDYSTSEFDENDPFLKVKLSRVTKVGNEDVMQDRIFDVSLNDLKNATYGQQDVKSETVPKFTFKSALLIDCKKADQLIEQYKEFSEKMKPVASIKSQLEILDSILTSSLF